MKDASPFRGTLLRLSLIIQNLHALMIPTRAAVFDECVLKLFRRYFIACNLLEDAQRAQVRLRFTPC